ncbi:MAG: proteasome accessory factor PafA2 family protein [Fimbriimonadaceae bacterium]|jgi:proteasome accessory factor A|nr:proteasome accessory factor PafA2 family protein [Fimbriimonadaceae bacterium]
MRRILAGIETEYGFTIEGRGTNDQVEDAMALVRKSPNGCLRFWDYRFESPRKDLRGFEVDQLSIDPTDAVFDQGKAQLPATEIRSDHILPNGARFYNDHGHPEYATPECYGLKELARHDAAGEIWVTDCAQRLAEELHKTVRVYKNNSDYHGASYGTHESYLVPRSLGFQKLYEALVPLLVARPVLTGAGKTGFEGRSPCDFQMSQRADFFTEKASVDTLYRRPIFNTRDEPHAPPQSWIRLHVISGDANLMPTCTLRKVGLVKLALHLLEAGVCPKWEIPDPASAMAEVSRSTNSEGRIDLAGASWTTPRHILESYLLAAQPVVSTDPELSQLIDDCYSLLEARFDRPDDFIFQVDWAAKQWLLQQALEPGEGWNTTAQKSLDLQYHLLDPDEGLYTGLVAAGLVAHPSHQELAPLLVTPPSGRAKARGASVRLGPEITVAAGWSNLRLRTSRGEQDFALPPDADYPDALDGVSDVEELGAILNGL